MSRRSCCRRAGLRDVLVQEAVLGERIMRALILRRVGSAAIGQAGPDPDRARRVQRHAEAGEFSQAQWPSSSCAWIPKLIRCAQTLLKRFTIAA